MVESVEKLVGLQRRLTVNVPAEEVTQAYNKRLQEIARTAKLPGFRPGKVPTSLLGQRHGKSILREVANDLMQTALRTAIEKHKLRLAGMPQVEPPDIVKNKPVEFIATFEVYPDIQLQDLTGNSVERIVTQVTDEDVQTTLQELRKQHAEWQEVERAAQAGDRVIIDFVGSIDDKPFERGTAQDFQLELGSKRMIAGFEEGIIGAKAGEQRCVDITFPTDYPSKELADQKARFDITLKQVMAPELPLLNDEFAKKIGFEQGVGALKTEVRRTMEKEVERVLTAQLKTRILDKLLELNPIAVPDALVEAEINQLQQMTQQQMAAQSNASEQTKSVDLSREPYVAQAKKRVTLGLLLSELIKQHQLKADADQVRAKVEEMAALYERSEEAIAYYYSDKKRLAEIEAIVLEELAVAKLGEQLEIKDKSLLYTEALKEMR